MPERTKNGFPYEEVERHDELSPGVPAHADASDQRKPTGQLLQGASKVPALGGKAHKGRTSLSHKIDAPTLTPLSQRRARTLRRAASGAAPRCWASRSRVRAPSSPRASPRWVTSS